MPSRREKPAGGSNAILVNPGTYGSKEELMALMENVDLRTYGDWIAEMKEIKERYGWPDCSEVGKFYPVSGYKWYYYVYGIKGRNESRPVNGAAVGFGYDANQRGPVVVVKSSPTQYTSEVEADPWITKEMLAEAILFNAREGRDKVFQERERQRFGADTGLDLSGVRTMHFQL